MTFNITIHTDGAAFEDNPAELTELLHEVAGRVEDGETHGRILDSNGNTVGEFETREEEG